MASRVAKKKTLLLLMMMQDEELPVSNERRINYHSCNGDAPIFNINANSLFTSILFNLFTTLFRHRHLQTQTCRMNDLPLIGSCVLRRGFWDRQGANIASR